MKALFAVLLAGSMSVLAAGGPVVAAAQWQTANSTATGDQDVASIAANRNGYVAVVWEDDRDSTAPENNDHSDIWLRLFRHGTAVYEVKLSAGGNTGVTTWRHLNPDVGLDDKGNAVVVWQDDPDGNGFYNIPYRVVSTAGAVTASGTANTSADGQQVNPRVAVDPDGAPSGAAVAFTVVWEDIQGSNPATVKAAGYTGPTTRAYEVTVSQAGGQHHNPDVAVSAAGDAYVVWDEDGDANADYNIGLTHLSKGGAVSSRTVANSITTGQQTRASVESTFNGEFAVAWQSTHTGTAGVWTRSFKDGGAARHPEVDTAPGGQAPSLGLDEQGGVVVVWNIAGTQDVWVRGFNPDGTDTARLAAQPLMNVATGKQEGGVVAVSAFGEVSVAYADDNDGNTWDQVYLGVGVVNTGW
ncbi:MAG TPA: hypothetical protein VFC19_51010 [Candidatus Limnocylindrales bacterium]|nr:hypothetical protein [Candidatus Limnocylindrales bacterium]